MSYLDVMTPTISSFLCRNNNQCYHNILAERLLEECLCEFSNKFFQDCMQTHRLHKRTSENCFRFTAFLEVNIDPIQAGGGCAPPTGFFLAVPKRSIVD